MKANRLFNVEYLLWLALALALAGSLKHLASVFASVDGHTLLGWIQAVAIDTGLFALAYKIKVRKAERQSIRLLTGAVALFTVISVYGNLTYGLAARGPLPGVISVTQPFVLAATLPVLVLILSHLLSDDRQHAADLAQREARRAARTGTNEASVHQGLSLLDKANDTRQAAVVQRRDKVLALLGQGQEAADIAAALGVSARTVRRDVQALNGRAGGEL